MSPGEFAPLARRETTQIHRVIIAAAADGIWQAITDPEWTVRYGFGGRSVVERLRAATPASRSASS